MIISEVLVAAFGGPVLPSVLPPVSPGSLRQIRRSTFLVGLQGAATPLVGTSGPLARRFV